MSECLRTTFSHHGAYRPLAAAAAHPGLWFDRFLREQKASDEKLEKEQEHPYGQLLDKVCAMREPSIYRPAFERWLGALDALGVRPRVATATVRLAMGHGRESVIETGLALHHTYGVPYIPGSSLKGVAAGFAAGALGGLWAKDEAGHHTLFGTTDAAAYVDFLDALPLPGTWGLQRDVLTVHHQRYYRGEDAPPADWDDPNPVAFLTAVGKFLIALCPEAGAGAWADAGYGILKMALEEVGVGGKTSSGFGRLRLGETLPRLEEGAKLEARVDAIKSSRITLTLRDDDYYVLGIPRNTDIDLYLPKSRVGNREFKPGQTVHVVVLRINKSQYDWAVECRPQTKEERG